ncbi:alpha/beta fold hydrolase [Streptomyces albireticuli]|uniref:Alpha/beta hydrolase n=1 Tax=Streptomyces albireticuli TaxID=1940 RepID=A0A2A2D1U5_9ACTN|nr:alpha/beta hydrolase [Streptomyces albireticuli]MCD9193457.1 alpha/beta hydrolase [Streptomyces albireticuli]PAU46448.1 alpha/beta hydrolase [Streptomyces albireticuli]
MELMVSVKDGEVWADDSGGDGLPLVLLHPGIGDSTVWDPVVPRLARRHRVIRYDVRGYGRSPAATAPYSLVEDLVAVLDRFEVERAALVGSSMGGVAAVSLALGHPERVAALALLCPGVTGYPGLTSPELMTEIERLAEAGDMDGLVALALRTWAAAGTGDDAEAAAQVRAAVPAWFTNYPHQVPDPPSFDRLGELDTPCLLVLAELDQPEVVRCNEEMAARIPGCRLVRLPGCDHLLMLRDPETVAELVLEVCDGLR